ncbi:prostatic acid phosphatase [Pseudonaja textilis]|uniref:prostatic acid phosphatase n=1 Tax=Pseudonaja textilis TaxID=8673 RepID=UPI000EA941F5|nr:prostatic acid phosphatase [Pseudonaja textilis]
MPTPYRPLRNGLYRHGDRSPLSSFPQNSVKEDAWPWGYGQLTKTGIQQAYNLGQWLKDRYKNFLSPSYKPKEIYVQSTDYDRTIMSAEVVLAGLFPPSAEEEWNPDIHWQPIPVHTMPLSEEKLLIYPNFKCSCFNGLLQQFKQEIKSKNILKKHMHDMTIIALQIALGVFNQLLPPYAATHIFELYEEDNGSHTIEMYYRNNTAVEPHMLTLPGCSKACPLEKFQNLITPILPTKEC